MKGLEFINSLRETVFEVNSNPVNHILFVENDYSLFQKVKKFSLLFLQANKDLINNTDVSNFVIDLMNRDNFKNRIKYAVIKLNEFNIDKGEYYLYISEGIKYFLISGKNENHHILSNKQKIDIHQSILLELSNCFRIWYFPRDIFHIKFAEERQLICRDNLNRSWTVSNLGSYFIGLSTYEAIIFLCAVEVVFNSEETYSDFLNLNTLNSLLNKSENEIRHWHSISYTLNALGLIKDRNVYSKNDNLTEFGRNILQNLKANYKSFDLLIPILLESEASGINYNKEELESNNIVWIKSSKILNTDQKKSISNASSLFHQKNYLDSLRILYPLLEGTLDSALTQINVDLKTLNGMQGKIEKLKKEKIISSKASTGIEIFSSRNKIVHGNIIEEDSETLKHLFSLVLSYLQKIVNEIESNLKM